jgi:GrpB-like predicted nucleotidyltransferase (UPF0157 family)
MQEIIEKENDKVVLEPYSESWISLFELEFRLLKDRFNQVFQNLYHIGSTSVPNLTAKPIIDVIAEVRSLELLDSQEKEFVDLGYEVKGENGILNRRYYIKRNDGKRVIHLHCYEKGNPEIHKHLKFKNILLVDRNILLEYEKLKIDLGVSSKDDRLKYTQGKTEFINRILNKNG